MDRSTAGQILAVLVCFGGTACMVGWFVQSTALITLGQASPIQFNAAMLFSLAGADMARRQEYRERHRVLPSLIITLAAITLSQEFVTQSFGIDEIIDSGPYLSHATPSPGRMAPNAAVCFLLYGFWRYRAIPDYGVVGLAISGLALAGYVLGIESFYHWSAGVTPMALMSAILSLWLFVVVSLDDNDRNAAWRVIYQQRLDIRS